jgi:putative heme-binding domain-containing protein
MTTRLFPQRAVLAVFACFMLPVFLPAAEAPAKLNLRPHDHICLIGNTLADRMQHDGWLETLLQARFPQYQFVIRDLGFSGDELKLRLRSADFGSPDEHLSRHKADVVFAFFGYNESFAGPAGLDAFKHDLDEFIKHTLAQRYNGKSVPRLVLFSPIAHEDLHDPNLPNGGENNQRLALYTKAMAEVARAQRVPFVDLFTPSKELYAHETGPLTINGIHLTEHGNYLLARQIDRALFPQHSELTRDPEAFARLRAAVRDKNFHWFERYRTVDGYSIYGGRADLRFVDGQTNRVVMQREMEVLDVMTANRDRRIWAVAGGSDAKVDDSNTPPFIPVKTNKPGTGPGGTHVFLGGEEAIKKMTVAKGMKINLFASEKEFPELAKPVQMAFDARGRLWVAAWPSYPHWKPKEEMNDKLLILEDTDGDGKADRCTVFADHLHCPTGFVFCNGGVLVAQAPGLLFLKDTKGTGKADLRVRVLEGIDSADTHHTANSFTLDPGGAIYFQEGTFHHTQVETPYGPPQRCANAGVYRYEPRTQKFEVYVTYGFANPHGHVFDRWGQDIVYDGTGANPYHAALFSGHLDFPHKHAHPPQVYEQRTRPCPGVEVLSSRHFPEANQGNLLVANVIGFQGILQYKVSDVGSSFAGTEVEPLVSSTDPNFRPSDIKIGPDGAVYFLDWQNPIIGHMQHNLRDPSRDRTHGRVYRITCTDRLLDKSPHIAGEPVDQLLNVLKEPENRVRERARIELAARDTDTVMSALGHWLERLDRKDPAFEHHLLEALWLHQSHNRVDVALLRRVLGAKEFRARAAATRVLCYWRDRAPGALDLLRQLAADPEPRVRLEAVRAASFFTAPEAIEIVLNADRFPTDRYLTFLRGETLKALNPLVKQALAAGRTLAFADPASTGRLLKTLATEDLLRMKRNRDVLREILTRPGLRDDKRQDTLAELARAEHHSELPVLLDALHAQDGRAGRDESVTFDLGRLLTGRSARELAGIRTELEKLAREAKRPTLREIGFVALVAADGNGERAWKLALSSPMALRDLVGAVPLLRDPTQRLALYPKIEPILGGLPKELSGRVDATQQQELRRKAMEALVSVRGQEVPAFRALARCIREGIEPAAAVRALARIPAATWPPEEVHPLLDSLLARLGKVPAEQRTSPEAVDALQLGHALAGALPAADAEKTRKQLGALGVRVLRLGTLPEQMLYDKDLIAVQAGRPVEILFENRDFMPHNFVLVRPGALEETGLLAETTATQPGAAEHQYVPTSDKILLASRLLQPRTSQTLRFTAPVESGVYPYVCTYPGHWRRMYGALYVVADLDKYVAEPEGYLTKHPLPVRDALLSLSRPRKEWKFDELAGAVKQLDGGRSFTNGKQVFQIASCIACHKLNGVGTEIGPDLAKLDPKLTAVDILRDIIEPSFRINERYQTNVIETQRGTVVTGLVVEETPKVLKVIENPLATSKPVVIQRSDVAARQRSPISIMPKGLLDKLTREEILDLVAYVAARGDPAHRLFHGDHARHHGAGR